MLRLRNCASKTGHRLQNAEDKIGGKGGGGVGGVKASVVLKFNPTASGPNGLYWFYFIPVSIWFYFIGKYTLADL